MESNPAQDAVKDLERVQAIHDRARAKLKAARGPKEQQRKTATWVGRLGVILASIATLGLAGLWLVWVPLANPEDLNPSVWAERPLFPILLAIALGLVYFALSAFRRRRRMPDAERVVRRFYDLMSADSSKMSCLSEHVILADLDGARRRPPDLNPETYHPPLSDRKSVDLYWRYLTKPKWTLRHTLEVLKVKVTPLEGDLCLAHVKLRAAPYRWTSLILMISIFVPIAVVLVHSLALGEFWYESAVFMAIIPTMSGYEIWRQRRGRVYRVRKLLVRCGKDWRFFCADWQGWEERDLSWLDGIDRP